MNWERIMIAPARGDVVVKVSVLMITYNQDQFVCQAIESVLSQQVDFEYELVIGEDCSTDRTREIVASFGEKFPDRIRLLFPKSNLGCKRTSKQRLRLVRDSTWPFLKATTIGRLPSSSSGRSNSLMHSDCAMCFHSVVRSSLTGDQPESILPDSRYNQDRYTTRDLLVENFIPTCSVMFRRGLFGELPDWMGTLGFRIGQSIFSIRNPDRLVISNRQWESTGYHSEGAWSGRSSDQRRSDLIRFYEVIDAHLKFKYHRVIKRQVSAALFELVSRRLREVPKPMRYFLQSVLMHPSIAVTHKLDLFGICFRRSVVRAKRVCLKTFHRQNPGTGTDPETIDETTVPREATRIAER